MLACLHQRHPPEAFCRPQGATSAPFRPISNVCVGPWVRTGSASRALSVAVEDVYGTARYEILQKDATRVRVLACRPLLLWRSIFSRAIFRLRSLQLTSVFLCDNGRRRVVSFTWPRGCPSPSSRSRLNGCASRSDIRRESCVPKARVLARGRRRPRPQLLVLFSCVELSFS